MLSWEIEEESNLHCLKDTDKTPSDQKEDEFRKIDSS